MWKSVKLHFSVGTNMWDFLKVIRFFQGLYNSDCFQILTLEVEKYRFKQKSGLNFCMYTNLGQGQVMTLTFNTHIPS